MKLTVCRRPRWAAAAVLGLSLIPAAWPAAAQPTQAQQSALRSNCRSDFMSHCSGVRPGGAEALQCLQRNVAKLSSACQSAVHALNPPPAKQAAPAAPPPPAPAAAPATAAAPAAPAAPPPAAPAPAKATAAHPPASAAPPRQPARPATPSTAAAPARPTAQQQAAIKQSCQSDFMARCRGVQPGGTAALQCLQRNAAQLSPNCRRAVAALGGGAPAAAATPAAAPATAAAPDAAPTPTPAQQSAVRFTCRRDFQVHCRGVPQGGQEAFACLQRNAARLSPDCRTSLAAIADDAPTEPAAAAAPIRRPIGPLRRAIRDRMMGQ